MSMRSLDKLYFLAEEGTPSELALHLQELETTYPEDRDLKNFALIAAAEGNRIDNAQTLLDQGACIEGASVRSSIRPLWKAAKQGHLEMVKFLVGRGANVAGTDNDGMNALDYARRYSRTEVVRFLESVISRPVP